LGVGGGGGGGDLNRLLCPPGALSGEKENPGAAGGEGAEGAGGGGGGGGGRELRLQGA